MKEKPPNNKEEAPTFEEYLELFGKKDCRKYWARKQWDNMLKYDRDAIMAAVEPYVKLAKEMNLEIVSPEQFLNLYISALAEITKHTKQ